MIEGIEKEYTETVLNVLSGPMEEKGRYVVQVEVEDEEGETSEVDLIFLKKEDAECVQPGFSLLCLYQDENGW